jgi:P-type Cu+ transporter
MFTDPVCGMEVYETMASANICHQGVVYYFCSRACFGAFQDNPEKYVEEVAQPRLQRVA